ncbi:MAG: aminotransferase class I/II-fold pyridoxal phosphate-dependent enzyme [Desulfobacteraceae bacterium]|nr:MAG: aminotransferase class I/II-fold pyridoxal phosphate-dependent enzyme [Desulfobacteraceae bacterium]
MHPIANELNTIIEKANPHVFAMLSQVGKNLFFPKGILTQGAEAKEKAHKYNATIGMATEKGQTMYLPSVMNMLNNLNPTEALTYAPSFGINPLRRVWQEALFEKNPSLIGKKVSLPVVTNAITHGLAVMADMWVDPGDTIILPDKNWGNYNLIFNVRHGAQMTTFPLFDQAGGFNLQGLEQTIQTEAQKVSKLIILLNFPNNPTGYTVTTQEADGIVRILTTAAQKGTNILAVTDDSYFGLFYEENVLKESIFSRLAFQHPKLAVVKVDGATKEYYVWGLRVGFITYGIWAQNNQAQVYEALEKKTGGAVRGSISSASHLGQSMTLKALQSATLQTEKDQKFKIMTERAKEVKRVLADPKYKDAWDLYPFNSGYFMCLRLKKSNAETLRLHLLNRYGVGLISLGEKDIRIAFSCVEKTEIRDLFDIILQGVKDLSAK